MKTKKLNYTRGFLDCLQILEENITKIRDEVPPEKQFETLIGIIGDNYMLVMDTYNKQVQKKLGFVVLIPKFDRPEKTATAPTT
jgi:hypothetical protein